MTTPIDQAPEWVADAVFYQIFPDRFARSPEAWKPNHLEAWDAEPTFHGYKGGDLFGVAERLDWIESLGCNAIYLNPIFQSASNHRYHTHDYFRIDPLLGGDGAFDALIDACQKRGVRVVLDGVFNHASRGFFQFSDLLEAGEKSAWRDWFRVHGFPLNAYRDDQEIRYDAWWGMPALPVFNTDNPAVREFLMTVGEHWMAKGVDGWRLDVPAEISTEGFWDEFRTRVRAVNPDAYLVGEVWDDASWWTNTGERFDGTMNYLLTGATVSFAGGRHLDHHLAEGLQYTVAETDAAGYVATLDHLEQLYPSPTRRAHLNFLGSHDTARVLSVAGDDHPTVVLAALLMFTSPGAPCIYYGDEIGMTGGHDPQNRRGFPWDAETEWNLEILEAFRSLARLRHDHRALRRGERTTLHAPEGSRCYIASVTLDDQRLLVAANASDHDEGARVDVTGAGVERLWGDGELAADGELSVPARRGSVWRILG